MLITAWLVACSSGDPAAECPDPACPDCPDQPLEDWEIALLQPTVERLRRGVVAVGERPFGVCYGQGSCDDYLGAEAGELRLGDHFVRAELSVPPIGAPWSVEFGVECAAPDGGGRQTHSATFELSYTGEERGYPLEPLWTIESPHPGGARECSYHLTPIRPDGERLAPIRGSYRTPAPEG